MNPRYLAYCRAHGRDPASMLAFDRERAPGGHMGPFIRWVSDRWEEWRRANGRRPMASHPDDHAPFDAWLQEATDARLALIRALAALHAKGQHLIDLILDSVVDEPVPPTPRRTPTQSTLF